MLGRGQGGGEKGGPRSAHQVFDKWKNKKEGGLERLLACMSTGGPGKLGDMERCQMVEDETGPGQGLEWKASPS